MSRPERYATHYASSSARNLSRGGAVTALLVLLALALLVLARLNHPLVANLRQHLRDIAAPASSAVSAPVGGLRALFTQKDALFAAFEENKKLRAENETLRHWQSVAQSLKAENDALRALAAYQPVANVSYITARVTGQTPGAYGASITLNVGEAAGAKMLQPVIDAFGLVGRIIEVGSTSSRVLLLTDSASRVPVITATSRIRAIAAGGGAGDDTLRLTFLGGDAAVMEPGESVVTTEEGGLIPGGIALGTLVKSAEGTLLVEPVRPLVQSEYMRVVVTQ
jgi:rod shape-determining protein MreC